MKQAPVKKLERLAVNWSGRIRWERDGYTCLSQVRIKGFSVSDLYFELEDFLEPGTKLECSIDMPPEMAFGEGVVMHCRGEAVEVKPLSGGPARMGVRMRTDHYSFSEALPGLTQQAGD